MAKEHFWGDPNENGERPCLNDGCTIRVAQAFSWWQRKKGGHWRRQDRELIPECAGKDVRA